MKAGLRGYERKLRKCRECNTNLHRSAAEGLHLRKRVLCPLCRRVSAHGWGKTQPGKTLPQFANMYLVTPTWGGPGYEQGMLHILRQFDTPLFHVALLPGQWAMCNRLGPKDHAVNHTDGTLTYGAPLVLHAYGGAKPYLRELQHLKWFVLGKEPMYG